MGFIEQATANWYQITSAIIMFYFMYLGTFKKRVSRILVYVVLINTLIAGLLGVYDELNDGYIHLISETELVGYLSFVSAYYYLSLKLILE
ncbi:hypothetical protein [Vibrio neptunius]|uniref:hypothetical protein n=1 Tax=Vibrio neptunius TaxID=170651 RepID=UPI001C5C893D|nr:hypothetical protein [Vibrio neptunius]QXX08687.1 hypothetical protein KW548_24255 [Vibrio neptunius]